MLLLTLHQASDLLFMPGNSLHHFRNKCKDTVSIGTRPWLHSAVKEAAMQNNISVPFSIRENFCLRSGITCTKHRKKHWKKAPMANLGVPAKTLNRDGAGSLCCCLTWHDQTVINVTGSIVIPTILL